MGKKLTQDEVVQRIKNINPNIEIVGEYIHPKIRLKCRCLIDGYEWEAFSSNLFKGSGCPKCAGNIKKTTEQYKQELKDKNIQVECLGKYVNTHIKILHRCLIHNVEWLVSPHDILNGQGCYKCKSDKNSKLKFTTEEYIQLISKIRNDILLLGEYKGANKKTLYKCLIHNIEWKTTPSDINKGCGCPQCKLEKISKSLMKSQDVYINQLHQISPHIDLLDNYIGGHYKHNFKCNICGYTWESQADSLISKHNPTGCPNCTSSKLEKKIKTYLDDNTIIYKQQYRIDKCRYKKPLPFDFAVFDKNNNLLCLIEADGRQHFSISQFGGIDLDRAKQNFEQQKIRDDIKNKYCQANNIKLLRIPYWEFNNIENILESELLKGGGKCA